MAVPNQYQQPYGQQPQWMPQGMNYQSNQQPNFNQILSQRNYGGPQQPQKNFGQNLSDFFLGTSGGYEQVSNLHPHQQYAQDQVLGSGLEALQNPYAGFDPIAEQAMRQFHTEYIPGLVERFTAGYGNNNRNSGALAGALGAAGSGLQSMLAAQRSQYGLQNRQQGLREAELGLKPQFENIYRQGQSGVLSDLPSLAAQGALMYATGGLSGASGISNLIGQGVNAAKKLGGNSQSPNKLAQSQPYGQFQQQQQQVADINRQYPSTAQGYGQTQLIPTSPQWYNYLR